MGNEEMGKWEEGTLHFTQQTADVFVTAVIFNVMRKSMSIYALFARRLAQRGYATALHHGLQANSK